MSSDQPTVPSYLESRKYMQGFAKNGSKEFEPNYLPSGQEDQSVVSLDLKYRKKKDYEIICEVDVEYAETKFDNPDPGALGALGATDSSPFPASCWASKTHDHARFATLLPVSCKLIVLPSAQLVDVQTALERMYEESIEKLNAWWNQKETEHLRARYVGSLFIYNPSKFKVLSPGNNKAWTKEDNKPLGTFLHENESSGGGSKTKKLMVKVTVRILRPISDKRCTIS